MATAIELITRAMRVGRIIGKDQTPTADEANDAFTMLNWMLDQWWTQSLAVYRIARASYAWPSGIVSRTIGPTGDFVADRPVRLAPGCSMTQLTVTYPLIILPNVQDYDLIPYKTDSGLPQRIFYDRTYPNGTLYLWPVPVPGYTLNLNSLQRIESVATLTDTLDLPPAYEMAIVYQLAMRLIPEYGIQPAPDTAAQARDALAVIKRANQQPLTMSSDPITSGYARALP